MSDENKYKVGGYSVPMPENEKVEVFGYSLKVLPLNMQYETEELRKKFEDKAFFLQFDEKGNPNKAIEIKGQE